MFIDMKNLKVFFLLVVVEVMLQLQLSVEMK